MPGMGAVGTTFMAGVELVRRGNRCRWDRSRNWQRSGSANEPRARSPKSRNLCRWRNLKDLVFGGWDIFQDDRI